MKKEIILCIFFFAFSVSAYCGQASRIELSDGSVINGEIVSFTDGVYAIKTAAFGEIKVAAAKVYKIESMNSMPSGMPVGSTGKPISITPAQIDVYKEKLMSNPESAAVITKMAADPQIQAIAKDPAIQSAIKSGDIQALMKNEEFMSIANDPRIQEAAKKLKQGE